jgi:hypothetical protein
MHFLKITIPSLLSASILSTHSVYHDCRLKAVIFLITMFAGMWEAVLGELQKMNAANSEGMKGE